MKNLSKSYYKDYFVGIDFDFLLNSDSAPENTKQTIKERNRELCSPHLLKTIESNPLTSCTFKLQIAYPGLVTGVGNVKCSYRLNCS